MASDTDQVSVRTAEVTTTSRTSRYTRCRRWVRCILSSRKKHYATLLFVSIDVASILAEILIALITCDMGRRDEPWVEPAEGGLQIVGLSFSSFFLLELLVTVWAFGPRYFSTWFHCFDGVVIVVSFVVDLLAHGIVEEIASLVVGFRLWRFIKIVNELSVGASERIEEFEVKVRQLEHENAELRGRLCEAGAS
ncbi:hypothetical protein VTK73DRAFT_1498 [Phialemonium thermophilum]|uniref:Voltage-gated hydrogen channel 1 n=1 Tax=Phialemonium thermophilum TaxID=223376 RepID=A0ABR3X926_9PEZI